MLIARRFDASASRDFLPHRLNVRRDLRRFGDQGRVDVHRARVLLRQR